MNKGMQKVILNLFAEVLSLTASEDERMKQVEEFDRVFGVSISDWEEQMKKYISSESSESNAYAEDAIRTIDAFHAKYHVFDENGERVYERTRFGTAYHQLVITYDANAPEEQQISVEEVPDIEAMPLEELQSYFEDLQSAHDDLEDEEPEDEDSEEYEKWENELSDLEELMDEVSERLEELGGDV